MKKLQYILKSIKPYYVLNWNINKDTVEYYDIMPYLVEVYQEEKKRVKPIHTKDINDIKSLILSASKCRFWSRCEYEILVTGFPSGRKTEKIDIYDQIEHNIDVIVEYFKSQVL